MRNVFKKESQKRTLTYAILVFTVLPLIILAGLDSVLPSSFYDYYNYIFISLANIVLLLTIYELNQFFFNKEEEKKEKWFSFFHIGAAALVVSLTTQISFVYEGEAFTNSQLLVLMAFASFTLIIIFLINSIINGIDINKTMSIIVVGAIIIAFFTFFPITTMKMQWNTIMMLFIIVIFSDTFAYLGGKKFGKTKIVPEISPNKSLEGFIVGFIMAISIGLIWYFTVINLYFDKTGFTEITTPIGIITVFITALLAPMGDLFFSALKRKYNRKDFANTLPGHGGILDRIDSHIFAVTIGSILLLIVQL